MARLADLPRLVFLFCKGLFNAKAIRHAVEARRPPRGVNLLDKPERCQAAEPRPPGGLTCLLRHLPQDPTARKVPWLALSCLLARGAEECLFLRVLVQQASHLLPGHSRHVKSSDRLPAKLAAHARLGAQGVAVESCDDAGEPVMGGADGPSPGGFELLRQ